jgi:hypothetical protein
MRCDYMNKPLCQQFENASGASGSAQHLSDLDGILGLYEARRPSLLFLREDSESLLITLREGGKLAYDLATKVREAVRPKDVLCIQAPCLEYELPKDLITAAKKYW